MTPRNDPETCLEAQGASGLTSSHMEETNTNAAVATASPNAELKSAGAMAAITPLLSAAGGESYDIE